MNSREALILLNMAGTIGSAGISRLKAFFGSPEAAVGSGEAALSAAGLGPVTAARAAALSRADLDRELERAEKKHVSVVTILDREYPAALRNIFDPPPVLYIKGTMVPDDGIAVAIVGSRQPSLYGMAQAKAFAGALAERGFTVVSGMARGVDTRAHQSALEKQGRTIAVLGSGLGRIYPPENRGLAESIAASGWLASEFPMECGPARHNFPRRNRIISGLSMGVLVVEAGKTSGSLITAALALEQGREVFALPGRADAPQSAGCNNLIREGAALVTCIEDMLDELPCAPAVARQAVRTVSPVTQLSRDDERRVYDIISSDGLSMDELCERSGMGIQQISAVLLKMQLSRLIRKLPGNRFSRSDNRGR